MSKFDERKISDNGLRDFAEKGEASERRSIIVELDIPPRTPVRPEWQRTPWKKGAYSSELMDSLAAGEERENKNDLKSMNQLEEKLAGLDLPEKPVRLDSAQAFVLSVTPEQLRTISNFSLAGLIRPNRVHYIA